MITTFNKLKQQQICRQYKAHSITMNYVENAITGRASVFCYFLSFSLSSFEVKCSSRITINKTNKIIKPNAESVEMDQFMLIVNNGETKC